jgi:NAD(P)H dehydrogenase (quinone)
MKVLTVYAHPNPKSFNHAVLERFTAGLRDAGHTSEVVDLYAIKFNPVVDSKDSPSWVTGDTPLRVLESMNLRQLVLDSCKNPLQTFLARRWLRGKNLPTLARAIHEAMPRDVLEQQRKVREADGLAFISPVYFVGFPAILKGWIERVFTLGFAFELSAEGWAGDVDGRIPLLKHQKALIINTTVFDERSYQTGIEQAMTRLMDDWCLRYPGIKNVEHVYFHAMYDFDADKRQRYLARAYRLGKEFDSSGRTARPTAAGSQLAGTGLVRG